MGKIKVIAFVGMPGSGKGTCTDYLAETYDFPVIHFGNMVYEEVQRRGLHNVEDEKFVREDMRKKEGPAVLAIRSAQKTKEYLGAGAETVVLDGLYSWTEYKYLHDQFSDSLVTIALAAPRHERHERVTNRKDAHRTYTLEQIHEREVNEIEKLEKGGPIAYADFTIVNDKTLQDMIDSLVGILKKLEVV